MNTIKIIANYLKTVWTFYGFHGRGYLTNFKSVVTLPIKSVPNVLLSSIDNSELFLLILLESFQDSPVYQISRSPKCLFGSQRSVVIGHFLLMCLSLFILAFHSSLSNKVGERKCIPFFVLWFT